MNVFEELNKINDDDSLVEEEPTNVSLKDRLQKIEQETYRVADPVFNRIEDLLKSMFPEALFRRYTSENEYCLSSNLTDEHMSSRKEFLDWWDSTGLQEQIDKILSMLPAKYAARGEWKVSTLTDKYHYVESVIGYTVSITFPTEYSLIKSEISQQRANKRAEKQLDTSPVRSVYGWFSATSQPSINVSDLESIQSAVDELVIQLNEKIEQSLRYPKRASTRTLRVGLVSRKNIKLQGNHSISWKICSDEAEFYESKIPDPVAQNGLGYEYDSSTNQFIKRRSCLDEFTASVL